MKNTDNIPHIAFDWYDEYAHGAIDRRTFINRLASLGIAGLGIAAVGRSLVPNYALAEQVSFNDPDIIASYKTFSSPKGYGEGRGYWVEPRGLAENDSRVNATWPDYEAALERQHQVFTMYMYPGVNHGFHNDSTARYNEEAAELAWTRTLAFFNARLRTVPQGN